ncbi:hypothetical protein [Streptomyces sp. NPDC001076]
MSDAKKPEATPQESHITDEEAVVASSTVEATPQESHITDEEAATDLDEVTTLESHITVGDPR